MRPNLSTLARRPTASRPATNRPGDVARHPGVASRPWAAAVNVAHRGASAYAPENTLVALRKAIARDADLVEVDVQRTRDGALVLVHDTTLERTTDVRTLLPGRGPWRVADLTLAELKRLDAGRWLAPEFAGERVPTLAEAIELLRPSGLGLLLELKQPALYPGIATELAAELRAADYPHRVVVQSFDESAVVEHKQAAPHLPVGLLGSPSRAALGDVASWADQVNPPHHRVDRCYVEAVHEAGMSCFVWTVNRSSAMRRVLDLGVDGVITNRPDVLHQVRALGPQPGLRLRGGRVRAAA